MSNEQLRMDSSAALRDQVMTQLAAQMASGQMPDLAKAFVAFWGDTRNVQKDAKNPHLKNEYATLEAVLNEIKPKAKEHGLAFPQFVGAVVDGKQQLTTLIVHTSGQSWKFLTEMHVPDGGLDKKTNERRPPGPQQSGIVISYMRRYSLMPLAGLSQTDDDGEMPEDDDEDESGDEGGAGNEGEVQALRDSMAAFKAKSKESAADTVARFEAQLKDRVSATGNKDLVAEFMAKRKSLKATK